MFCRHRAGLATRIRHQENQSIPRARVYSRLTRFCGRKRLDLYRIENRRIRIGNTCDVSQSETARLGGYYKIVGLLGRVRGTSTMHRSSDNSDSSSWRSHPKVNWERRCEFAFVSTTPTGKQSGSGRLFPLALVACFSPDLFGEKGSRVPASVPL